MKYITAFLLLLCCIWAGVAIGATSDIESQVEEAYKLSDINNNIIVLEGGATPLISVTFPHKEHRQSGIKCKNCHHNSSADIPYSSCRAECHTVVGARERDQTSMFMAFHTKGTERSCYGCHSMQAEKDLQKYADFQNCRPCHAPKK